jgi:SAM-dependent methyltransferase
MSSLSRKIVRRAGSPLARLYYRFLFGGDSGLARACGRWVTAWEASGSRGDVPVDAGTWDDQYRSGHWSFLHDPSELARYGALAASSQRLTPARTILDVGCGEGILRELLRDRGYQRYVGVDLSSVAIEAARRSAAPEDSFVVADAETYAPGETFDAVVLNECLYYFHDPLEQAERYMRMTTPEGALIISMFESPRTRAILRVLERRRPRAERVRLEGHAGAWLLAAFQHGEGATLQLTSDSPTAPTPR